MKTIDWLFGRNIPVVTEYDKDLDNYLTGFVYPSHTFIKTIDGELHYYQNGKLFSVPSDNILKSWRPVAVALAYDVDHLTSSHGGVLGFRNGSYLESYADGKLYIISGNKKRHITSQESLDALGLTSISPLVVSKSDLEYHVTGDDI